MANHNPSAISRRLTMTCIQTLLGILFLAFLTIGGVWLVGFHWSIGTVMLGLWVLFPIVGWYYSGTLVKKLMRCQEPDLSDPEHARLVRIVDNLFPKTGLTHKPPVYISPMPVPNAFATGRNPKESFIACTEGLFDVGLTDEEMEAVLAHELGHVKSRDVMITSFTAILGSMFSLVLAQGLPWLFNSLFTSRKHGNLLDKLDQKVRRQKRGFFAATGGIAGFFVMAVLFYIISTFARLVTLFVSRCRESHADALAAEWTGNPCALSTALQKIVLWMNFNSGPDVRYNLLTSGLRPLLFVSSFDDGSGDKDKKGAKIGIFARVRRWWRRLGENHPPVPERLKDLDQMAGSTCQRLF